MDFRLLGPVEVAVGDRVLDIGPSQRRLVLAILASEAGRTVSSESLVDRVWDEAPDRARRTLHVHISRIRRLLEACAVPVNVVRRSGGYLLDVDLERVDAHRFRRLVDTARERERPERERLALLGQAMDLWRGPPLAGLPGEWAARVRQGWQQQYLEAVVAWALACPGSLDPGAALPRLGELVDEFPLVESLAAAYMRVLCAAGRPAAALDHFTNVRRRLADELGADPAPELRQLHRQILSDDLAPARPAVVTPTRVRPITPRQLPAPPQVFVGRTAELAALDRVIEGGTVVVATIDGMAGVGKTALVVYAAHRFAGRYPDGQLFVDLCGFTRGVEPVEPAAALDVMLRALGVPGPQIPVGLAERAALYRSRLTGRRMMIVLDNAAGESQVVPLVPGGPGCLVLVTSRRRLVGLDDGHSMSVGVLSVAEAVSLLARTVGGDLLAGGGAAELVDLCGRLPLAIRIAAARLRSHPAWTLPDLVRQLGDQRHRLVELEAGQRSITAALDLSYQHLSADQQRTYRLLGLHPGTDVDACATAALFDSTLREAGRMLEQLLEAHLLQEPTPGRYRFHDLIRAHAAHAAARDETPPARVAAMDRLLDHYRHTASLGMDAAYPYQRERRPQVPSAGTPTPDLADPAPAVDWLDTELPNLLAVATYAIEHSRPAHTLHLSTILHRHLRTRGRYHDALTLHHQALTTARATGHQAAELEALLGLGWVHRLQGRYERAIDRYQQALHLARGTGDRPGELTALTGLGETYLRQGRYERATDRYQQALGLASTIGDRHGELNALVGLGQVHQLQSRYEQATDHFGQALRLARATGNLPGELNALTGLGLVHQLQSRYEQATDYLGAALRIARATGHRPGELNALIGLGHVHRRQGRYEQATDHYQQLFDLARESDDRNSEFEAWHGLGRLQHVTGHADAAITHHDQALALACELGQPVDQVRAHDGLAGAHHTLSQLEPARQHWQKALDILSGLGAGDICDDEASLPAIRARLTALDAAENRNGRAAAGSAPADGRGR